MTVTASPSVLEQLAVDGWQVRRAPATQFTLDENEFTGRAVPYGVAVELFPGLVERFERGAFAAATRDPARVKVAFRHGEVIGHVVQLEERDDGLHVRGRIVDDADLPDGRKALAQLRAGLVDELSVGFQELPKGTVVTTEPDGSTLVVHKRARLREISIVPWGAYGRKATVAKVRHDDAWRERWNREFDALGATL